MADRNSGVVLADKNLKYLVFGQQGRAERGKTFAGRANKEFNKINMRKHRAKKALDRHYG
jgi:hypothetical protein